ncbi:unnamed protein product, partial [Phaeothamnion confervicola]
AAAAAAAATASASGGRSSSAGGFMDALGRGAVNDAAGCHCDVGGDGGGGGGEAAASAGEEDEEEEGARGGRTGERDDESVHGGELEGLRFAPMSAEEDHRRRTEEDRRNDVAEDLIALGATRRDAVIAPTGSAAPAAATDAADLSERPAAGVAASKAAMEDATAFKSGLPAATAPVERARDELKMTSDRSASPSPPDDVPAFDLSQQ